MTRTNRLLMSLASILAVMMPLAVPAQVVEESTSSIEIKWDGGGHSFRIENRNYIVHSIYRAGEKRTLVLDESISGTYTDYQDGCCGTVVRVVAQVLDSGPSLTPAWELAVDAHKGELSSLGGFGDAYVATHYGCCGSFSAQHYFSLATGQHLITANGPLAMLRLSNQGELTRLAGVEVPWSVNWELYEERKDAIGVLYYSSIDQQIDRVLIAEPNVDALGASGFFGEAGLSWVSNQSDEAARELTLQLPEDERSFSTLEGVSLRVTFGADAWVEIPISGDRLDIDNARMSESLALERL